jgi:hypothetical protein
MSSFNFKPLKHNPLVAAIARPALWLGTRELEKVIFTATTGRSGTLALAKLFAAVPDCVALHEPPPIMNGPVLEAANFGDTALSDRVYRQIKAINIRRSAMGYRYYMEANHLFIKSFVGQAIDDFGVRLGVIHLVRPATEVATSIYRLQDYPGTERGNFWWLNHRAPANLIQVAQLLDSDGEFSHPYYKALWYWHEVEARIAALRLRVPQLNVVRFETGWLNDANKIYRLLDELGCEYDKGKIAPMVGVHAHEKEDEKTGPAPSLDDRQAMLSRLRDLLATRGFKFA